ncbi:hypothetical protein EVAR_49269_1 [Eumeta japonica]|uniref:Uncharacterized protein n=1 Tax=Eumeta variegata TaxID=151549 RepID=A0A4C1YKZ3_EUMVA|nr:hypothetical protein EVAR_49269_1 [Eumeta japonica]
MNNQCIGASSLSPMNTCNTRGISSAVLDSRVGVKYLMEGCCGSMAGGVNLWKGESVDERGSGMMEREGGHWSFHSLDEINSVRCFFTSVFCLIGQINTHSEKRIFTCAFGFIPIRCKLENLTQLIPNRNHVIMNWKWRDFTGRKKPGTVFPSPPSGTNGAVGDSLMSLGVFREAVGLYSSQTPHAPKGYSYLTP